MQNVAMATPPDKSKPSAPPTAPAARPYDPLFDPLPVPEAIESDSDTAWGLWEHTLHAHDAPEETPESDTAYDETIAGDLTSLDGKKV